MKKVSKYQKSQETLIFREINKFLLKMQNISTTNSLLTKYKNKEKESLISIKLYIETNLETFSFCNKQPQISDTSRLSQDFNITKPVTIKKMSQGGLETFEASDIKYHSCR